MGENRKPRRGGPNGVWCLGNAEPDGRNWLANWNGNSVGCVSREAAGKMVVQLRDADFEAARVRNEEMRNAADH